MQERFGQISGTFRDLLLDASGHVLYDSGWGRNAIMSGCRVLLAALIKGDQEAGLKYWAVGEGQSSWDAAPPAVVDRTRLVSEVARQPIAAAQVQFWNTQWQTPGNDMPSAVPSFALDIRVEFKDPIWGKTLREFGLFGGNAAAGPNTGYLINHKVHTPLQVPSGATLQRRLVLTF